MDKHDLVMYLAPLGIGILTWLLQRFSNNYEKCHNIRLPPNSNLVEISNDALKIFQISKKSVPVFKAKTDPEHLKLVIFFW